MHYVQNEPLKSMESFKYLGLEVPSNHKWNECSINHLEAGKRAYYAFDNTCNHRENKYWILKKYFFDTNVSVLVGSMEHSVRKYAWKKFEMSKSISLQNFSKLRNKCHTTPSIIYHSLCCHNLHL